MSQKLSALEVEAERADDRLSDDQARIMELTEEYKVVADNMKSLEASEAVLSFFNLLICIKMYLKVVDWQMIDESIEQWVEFDQLILWM